MRPTRTIAKRACLCRDCRKVVERGDVVYRYVDDRGRPRLACELCGFHRDQDARLREADALLSAADGH